MRQSRTMSRFARAAVIATIVLVVAVVVIVRFAIGATPYVRDRVVAAMNERFDSHVELSALDVKVFPRPAITGRGLVLRRDGTSEPPLLRIDSFEASAGLAGLRSTPLRLATVELEGLDIRVPRGGFKTQATGGPDHPVPDAGDSSPEPAAAAPYRPLGRFHPARTSGG